METFWNVIGHIADSFGIVGMAITIWQLLTLKSKVENSEKSIRSVLDMREHEKIKLILDRISEAYKDNGEIIRLLSKPGRSDEHIRQELEKIEQSLDRCVTEIPGGKFKISKSIKNAADKISDFLRGSFDTSDELKDAQTFLFSAMELLKTMENDYINKEVVVASNQND